MNSEGKPLRRIVVVDGLDFWIFVSRQSWQPDLADRCPTIVVSFLLRLHTLKELYSVPSYGGKRPKTQR